MRKNKLQKLFGIGPIGACISILLLALFTWENRMAGYPVLTIHAALVKFFGAALVIFGFGLHAWSFSTLRNWWKDDQLCTTGPFRYFRHPMYAAWITFVCPGVALYLNSWIYLFWVLSLHPVWHTLVTKEEAIMINTFGDTYRDYAGRTGRFIPRIAIIQRFRPGM